MAMRAFLSAFSLAMVSAACADREAPRAPDAQTEVAERTAGETRETYAPGGQAPAIARSGPNVPIALPEGFALYPGAKVVSNTVVERGRRKRSLLVFETDDPVDEITSFYRRQAEAAGAELTLDIGGETRASLGGRLPTGGTFVMSVRRGPPTRAELAFD